MPFAGGIGVTELIIVLAIVLIIFGPKRLPAMGRSLGGGLREFKNSISGRDKGDDDDADEDDSKPELTASEADSPEAASERERAKQSV